MKVNKATGQIHPFGGLRGDAKELWRNITTRQEGRVKLVNTRGGATSIALKMYEEAAVVVWACGYGSNAVPVSDENKRVMNLRTFRGQVEVDDGARVLDEGSGGPVPGLFGCGLGFGFKVPTLATDCVCIPCCALITFTHRPRSTAALPMARPAGLMAWLCT